MDKSDCWGELAERSLLRYREIEEASGVAFYQEVGFLSLIDDKYQDTEKLRQASEKLHSLGYKCEDIVDNTRLEIYTKTPPSCVLVYSNEYCGSTADYVNVSLSRSIIERFMLQIPRFEHFQSGVWLLPAGPLRLHQPEEAGGGSAEAGREGRLSGHQVAGRGCSQTSHSATRSGVDAIKGGPDSVTGEYELSFAGIGDY